MARAHSKGSPMSDTCPRCDRDVRLTDPHRDCPGPPWVTGAPIDALTGAAARKTRLSGTLPTVNAVNAVITIAAGLATDIACHCNECWTSRGRHDPHGCAWEELTELRAAVAKMREGQSNRPDRAVAPPIGAVQGPKP